MKKTDISRLMNEYSLAKVQLNIISEYTNKNSDYESRGRFLVI